MKQHRWLRALPAMLLGFALSAGQVTWALAGTTGGLSGSVSDDRGAPVADADVSVVSASQSASAKTDGTGHFVFVSLVPDTYTISIDKGGYQSISLSGVTVFADQTQSLALRLPAALTNIATVISKAPGNLVKPGTTSDVYSVNASTQTALAGIGGGKNLDSAYSAIYSTPGVSSYVGNYGYGQTFYIRGGSYTQSGYEFDGVPVNRAFDNYNANSLSNLGQQELQVYTGGTPSGSSSATLAGFINQVIKAGTYPGFASLNFGIGNPAFYHTLSVEAGGATPNRLFSYYVGLRGSNSSYRVIDNADGGDIRGDGSGANGLTSGIVAPALFAANPVVSLFTNFYANGPFSSCVGGAPPAGSADFEGLATCNSAPPFAYGVNSNDTDRENIFNFHFGVPHKHDGGKDDIQLLYDNSSYHAAWADSLNDMGGIASLNHVFNGYGGAGGITQGIFGITSYNGKGGPADNYCAALALLKAFAIVNQTCATSGPSPVPYQDGYIFPSGTQFGQHASGLAAVPYYFPSSSTSRAFASGMDPAQRDAIWNNAGIVKLQYQKNIGTNAYLRLFGYTFYSDWLQNGPNQASFGNGTLIGYYAFDYPSQDYELNTHTRGAELQYADQIDAKNLIKLTGNYTTATLTRFNNSGSFLTTLGSTSTNLADASGNCYNYTTGAAGSCLSATTAGTFGSPTRGEAQTACATPALAATAACTSNAQWLVTVPSGSGTLNTVVPTFVSAALEDEFRPNDKLDLNVGLRFESYKYGLTDLNTPAYNFWFNAAQHSYCYDPTTGIPMTTPIGPTTPPGSSTPIVANVCPTAPSGAAGVHPDGVGGHLLFSNIGPTTLTKSLVSPRLGGTYTLDPETVIRFSAGRYSQPTETAFEQYYNQSPKSATSFDYTHFFGIGFTTPVHDNAVQVSNNADISLEKRLHGTDVTFKLTPFYRYTTNQIVSVTLGPSFASGVNVGTQKTSGLEFQISKGDPSRDGWSGTVSYTYTKAKVKYNGIGSLGRNAIDVLNDYIKAFNGLTQAGGGAPCYDPTTPNPASPGGIANSPLATCAGNTSAIKNPYYGMAQQPLLDRNGYYDTYPNAPPGDPFGNGNTAISPNFFSGFVSYKHDKLTVTPTFQLAQGQMYGSPTDVIGTDPRTCASNEFDGGRVAGGSPYAQNADYQSCTFSAYTAAGNLAIPNPYTGTFDGVGQFRNPWILNLSAQIAYDFTPKVKGTLLLANVFNRCFGGTKTAWSTAYPANSQVCGYGSNGSAFIGTPTNAGGMTNGYGWYYGASGADPANGTTGYPKVFDYPYIPVSGAIPLQAYFQLQIKL